MTIPPRREQRLLAPHLPDVNFAMVHSCAGDRTSDAVRQGGFGDRVVPVPVLIGKLVRAKKPTSRTASQPVADLGDLTRDRLMRR